VLSDEDLWDRATRPGPFDWIAILLAIAAFGLLIAFLLKLVGILDLWPFVG
jgi:hypothetical protein